MSEAFRPTIPEAARSLGIKVIPTIWNLPKELSGIHPPGRPWATVEVFPEKSQGYYREKSIVRAREEALAIVRAESGRKTYTSNHENMINGNISGLPPLLSELCSDFAVIASNHGYDHQRSMGLIHILEKPDRFFLHTDPVKLPEDLTDVIGIQAAQFAFTFDSPGPLLIPNISTEIDKPTTLLPDYEIDNTRRAELQESMITYRKIWTDGIEIDSLGNVQIYPGKALLLDSLAGKGVEHSSPGNTNRNRLVLGGLLTQVFRKGDEELVEAKISNALDLQKSLEDNGSKQFDAINRRLASSEATPSPKKTL